MTLLQRLHTMFSFRFLALILLLPSFAFAADVTFNRSDLPAGKNPSSLVSADFNHDGAADLAVSAGDSVLVFLGNGNGSFRSPATYQTAGAAIGRLAVGHFNRSGFTDIEFTNSTDNGVYILAGNSDGTFKPAVKVPNATAIARSAGQDVAVADYNRDGISDIATVSGATSVDILLGNGDGTFRKSTMAVGQRGLQNIGSGDLNGDGIPDLLIVDCCANPDVSVEDWYDAFGNGDGTFRTPVESAQSSSGFYDVVFADMNNDHLEDPVFGSNGCHTPCNGVGFRPSKGDGTFTPGAGWLFPTFDTVFSVGVGDFNGDGTKDLAIPIARASAGFDGPPMLAVLPVDSTGKINGDFEFQVGNGARALTVADFNGDGKPDVAVSDSDDGTVSIFLNTTGSSTTQPGFAISAAPASMTVTRGQSASYTVSVVAQNGAFNNPVALSCSGLPQGASCTFNPTSVTPGATSGMSTMTIATTATTAQAIMPGSLGLSAFATVMFPLGFIFVGNRNKKTRTLLLAGFTVLLLVGVMSLVGCGGGGKSASGQTITPGPTAAGTPPSGGTGTTGGGTTGGSGGTTTGGTTGGTTTGGTTGSGGSGTPAGTYTITVTGAAGATSHATTVTLVVQ
jgi:hypothetical protein